MLKRVLLVASLALVAAVITTTSAQARPGPYACQGSGHLDAEDGSPATWEVSGQGLCFQTPFQEARRLTFEGTGTSDSLGLCSGQPLVTNLSLNVTVTTVGVSSGRTLVENHNWSSPISVFPLATPFLVRTSDNRRGAGVVFHRIFLRCPGGGDNIAANFAWARL